MADKATFTVEQAVCAQRELRTALGLGEETFALPAFIGMNSDEVQQMREAGRTDDDVLAIILKATGRVIDVADLERFYAPPEARRGHG